MGVHPIIATALPFRGTGLQMSESIGKLPHLGKITMLGGRFIELNGKRMHRKVLNYQGMTQSNRIFHEINHPVIGVPLA